MAGFCLSGRVRRQSRVRALPAKRCPEVASLGVPRRGRPRWPPEGLAFRQRQHGWSTPPQIPQAPPLRQRGGSALPCATVCANWYGGDERVQGLSLWLTVTVILTAPAACGADLVR
jgi:hypothetical protein